MTVPRSASLWTFQLDVAMSTMVYMCTHCRVRQVFADMHGIGVCSLAFEPNVGSSKLQLPPRRYNKQPRQGRVR